MRWALWRLPSTHDGDEEGGDIEQEEDETRGEVTMIVKTLKPTAERRQLEKFLSEVLVFHALPPHPHLAQVYIFLIYV